jgi:SAM-dependent methyltransferase
VGDYTGMAAYYDLIMTSGYYDYDAIVDVLVGVESARTVLEIGAGTGLILERLAARRPQWEISGIDLTQAMLDIAVERLAGFPQVTMHLQNVVTLRLDRMYDLAYSYGGVWYFVPDKGAFSMVSHLRDEEANQEALRQVAAHVPTGGTLLLGVQSPHKAYASPVANGFEYAQRITPIPDGFRKDYSLADDGRIVMEQTIDYRTYAFEDAMDLLAKCGFEYRVDLDTTGLDTTGLDTQAPLFLEFGRR